MPTADVAARDRDTGRPIRNVLVIARQAQGLTLADLAERMGCLPKQLSNWENAQNMPGVAWMATWADALGYELALLPKAADRG